MQPMRCGFFPVQQPRVPKNENAVANRNDSSSIFASRSQRVDKSGLRRFVFAVLCGPSSPARNNDRVGFRKFLQAVFRLNGKTVRRPQLSPFDSTRSEVVPVFLKARSYQAKELRHNSIFETWQSVVNGYGNCFPTHGVIVTKNDVYATFVWKGFCKDVLMPKKKQSDSQPGQTFRLGDLFRYPTY